MISLARLAVFSFALLGAFAASGGGSLAQGDSAYRSADAVAGKSHRLGVYGNVQKDCTSGPLPTIRVVTPPRHGEMNVRSGTLKAGRIARCPNLAAKAQGIFYTANSSYRGSDELTYEVRSASGKVESHTVRIMVKEAPPSGAAPNPDSDQDL